MLQNFTDLLIFETALFLDLEAALALSQTCSAMCNCLSNNLYFIRIMTMRHLGITVDRGAECKFYGVEENQPQSEKGDFYSSLKNCKWILE